MKKLVLLLALVLVTCVSNAYALIEVGDFGETFWQTYSYTASKTYTSCGFLVTDVWDAIWPSQMLIDNVRIDGTVVESFEAASLPGTGWGSGIPVASYTRLISPFTHYLPTLGSQMALLDSVDGDSGVDTSAFGYGAVDGTYGYVDINLEAGHTLMFDWAFMTQDLMPDTNDYCMLLLKDEAGAQENIMLANVGYAVPEPASLSLLGLGLLGLVGLKRKKIA